MTDDDIIAAIPEDRKWLSIDELLAYARRHIGPDVAKKTIFNSISRQRIFPTGVKADAPAPKKYPYPKTSTILWLQGALTEKQRKTAARLRKIDSDKRKARKERHAQPQPA